MTKKSARDSSAMSQLAELDRWLQDGSLAIAAEHRRLGTELDEVRSLLRDAKQELKSIANVQQAADMATRVAREVVEPQVKRLADAGRTLQKAATRDDLYEWRRVQWPLVTSATATLEREFKTAWKLRCETTFTEHEALGDVLKRFAATRKLGTQMQSVARAGRLVGARFPPDAGDRKSLEDFEQQVHAQRDQLKNTGGSEDVTRLLLAAVANKATLADVTAESLEWLRTNGALAAIELRLRRAEGT